LLLDAQADFFITYYVLMRIFNAVHKVCEVHIIVKGESYISVFPLIGNIAVGYVIVHWLAEFGIDIVIGAVAVDFAKTDV
jgi:hypothetical protein